MTLELPGINILTKYKHQLIGTTNDLKTIVETSGMVSHFDRQKLFGMGWKRDIKAENRFILDSLLIG